MAEGGKGRLLEGLKDIVLDGDLRDTAPAEPQVATKVTFPIVGALQMKASPLNQPFDLEEDARVDQAVEVSARMLEGEGVRVD